MTPVLRERLKVINPWLEDDQIEDVVKQLTASFPSTGLLENNKHLFQLLLENTSVSENRQNGEKSPTVRFADFATHDNNRFIAVCQFKVRVLGTEHHIIPDIVLFLNGLPVVVIECKSPKVKDAIPEAIDQLLRYSEQRGATGEGNAPLFYYNQFVVATCRQEAKFGTITTHTEKYFYRWADPHPRTVDELDHGSGSPNDQRFLIPASHVPDKKGAMREWYIERAKERVLPRVVKQARELGVSFGQARIVDNRYRWGSCTVRDNINLNWRLVKAPIFVIDYVIAHELAHLLEPNHTQRFWNIVKTRAPTMDRARDWLREHGQLLEEEV